MGKSVARSRKRKFFGNRFTKKDSKTDVNNKALKMPSRCWVPLCNGNCRTGPRVSVFRFPRCPDLRQKWLNIIQRENKALTKHSSVCELHFKKSDFETEASAFDPRTGRTITAPLCLKRLKKGVIPSILPASVSSTSAEEAPLEKRPKLETEHLETPVNKSFESASLEYSAFETSAGTSSSSTSWDNRHQPKIMTKRARKQTKKTSSDPVNGLPFSDSQLPSNGTAENDTNKAPDLLIPEIHIKQEPQWDYESVEVPPQNSTVGNTAESMQISKVMSYAENHTEEANKAKDPAGNFDSCFYTKPLNMDLRDQAFGSFIACEMSDLRDNPELYMRTKQSILKILTEAHFEQMSSGVRS